MRAARDLSGFGTAATDGRRKGSSAPGKGSRSRPVDPAMKRITLSLPIATADVLRARVAAESTYYLDIIVDLHLGYAAEAAGEQATETEVPAAMPASLELRRRPPAGRVQIPLNIPTAVLGHLDAMADELEISRSAYVTELLGNFVD